MKQKKEREASLLDDLLPFGRHLDKNKKKRARRAEQRAETSEHLGPLFSIRARNKVGGDLENE